MAKIEDVISALDWMYCNAPIESFSDIDKWTRSYILINHALEEQRLMQEELNILRGNMNQELVINES